MWYGIYFYWQFVLILESFFAGGVPFIKVGAQIVSEFEPIVEYLDLKVSAIVSNEHTGTSHAVLVWSYQMCIYLPVENMFHHEVFVSEEDFDMNKDTHHINFSEISSYH